MLSPVVIAGAFVALACWVLTAAKLRDVLRDPHNRRLRYLTVTLVAVSLAMTLQPLAQWLDHTSRVLDLGRVTGNLFSIGAAGFAQVVLLHMARPEDAVRRQVRHRLLLMVVVAAVVAVLFLVTPPAYDVSDPYVTSHAYYYDTPTVAGAPYQLIVIANLGWAAAEATWRTRRFARAAAASLLRAGMLLMGFGCLLILVYLGLKLATIVLADRTPTAVAFLQNHILVPCFTAAALTILCGATLPSWGRWLGLERLWDASTARRQCRRLGPLWTLVATAVPRVTLLPHPFDPALRRARMTVEILDGYVELSQWFSADVTELAHRHADRDRIRGPARDAAIEAAVLAAAARDARAGRPPTGDATRPQSPPARTPDSAAAQVTRLLKVADALERSRIIAATLHDAG